MNSKTKYLHETALVADIHCDTVIQMRRGYDISKRHSNYHIDLPRLKDGGVNLQVFASFANPFVEGKSQFEVANEYIDTLTSEISRLDDRIIICLNCADIEKAGVDGKIAAVLGIENGAALENSPERLEYFYNKGVRIITLAHEDSTDWCLSWNDENPSFDGLTDLGREIVKEMNRLGMIIDVSHCAASSVEEILKTSRHPIIASHSGAASLSPSKRNLADHHIKAIAEGGGVIGVTFVFFLLKPELDVISNNLNVIYDNELRALTKLFVSMIPEEEFQAEFKKLEPFIQKYEAPLLPLRPTVKDVVDHIDYIVKLAGVDCVAIGSDFDGMNMPPIGLEDCSGIPNLTAELVERGYGDSDVMKILGGNFIRVFRKVCG